MAQLTTRARWLIAPVAGLWAALIGLVVCGVLVTAIWATSMTAGSTWLQPVRASATAWVVTHGVGLKSGTATYSLVPWGLLIVWGLLVFHAGRWAARIVGVESLRSAVWVAAAIAVTYAITLTAVSALTATDELRTSPLRAFGIGLAFGFVVSGVGALRGAQRWDDFVSRIPALVRVAIRAGLAGVSALLGFAALLLAIGLVLNVGTMLDIQRFIDPGLLGGLALLIVSLGYLPVAIMWSAAYLLGAGVALGGGSLLSAFVSTPIPTQLPAIPLLAALPQQATPLTWALPVLAVIAGIMLGLVVVRHSSVGALARMALVICAAFGAAIVLAFLARLSYGSLGDVRLVGMGPSSQMVALLVGGALVIGGIPTVLVVGRAPKAVEGEPAEASDEPSAQSETVPSDG